MTPLHGSTSRKQLNQIIFKTEKEMNTKTTYPTNPFKTVEEWNEHIKTELEVTKSKNKVTKHGNVKSHLISKGSITSLEAINLYNATRLSAIIYNLRHNEKMTIVSEDVKAKDCNGNTVVYSNYKYVAPNEK